MVNWCSAQSCSNTSDVYPGLIFHGYPLKNPEVLAKWVMVSKRKDFKPSANHKICGSHFQPSDYDPPVICGRPRLKKDAVPSIFDFPEHLMLKPGEKRMVKVVKRVLSSSTCENIEESSEVNQPVEEVVKKFCTVGTQTMLTGPELLTRLSDYRKERRSLLRKVSRQDRQISKLREMLILLKENGAVTPDVWNI